VPEDLEHLLGEDGVTDGGGVNAVQGDQAALASAELVGGEELRVRCTT
jgi:hypothetical protein